jgi:hypothetical protein
MRADSVAGAQKARVTALTPFPLASMTVRVLEVEGTVQLVWVAEDWPGQPKVMSNQFAGPETAAQLRAIAGKLDEVFAAKEVPCHG